MNITSQIKQPIFNEMELFEKKFHESMTSKVALLNRITYYIVNRKGKQMRPMFVFLTAKMVSEGIVNERTYRGASVIELIHTATLVHDDGVDESGEHEAVAEVRLHLAPLGDGPGDDGRGRGRLRDGPESGRCAAGGCYRPGRLEK